MRWVRSSVSMYSSTLLWKPCWPEQHRLESKTIPAMVNGNRPTTFREVCMEPPSTPNPPRAASSSSDRFPHRSVPPPITHPFTRQGLRVRRTGIESARHSFAMRFALPLFVLLFLSWTPAPCLAHAATVSVSGKPLPAADLFDKGDIPRVRLELSDGAIESLRKIPRKYVVGSVVEGARRYPNVSIRLKGGPGSFRPLEDRPAF